MPLISSLGRWSTIFGAAANGALVVLGDGLGIYTALAEIGPATSEKLAEKTKLNERQLREWLSAQAASGYVSYDAANNSFFLTSEQTAVFADPNSPAAMVGGFYGISALYHDEPLVAESFRTGRGLPWGKHHTCVFCGIARFFRSGYQANINAHWSGSIQNLRVHMNASNTWNAKFQIAFQFGHHLMRFPERRLRGEFSFERDYQSQIRH
jgi:hypothetical protein